MILGTSFFSSASSLSSVFQRFWVLVVASCTVLLIVRILFSREDFLCFSFVPFVFPLQCASKLHFFSQIFYSAFGPQSFLCALCGGDLILLSFVTGACTERKRMCGCFWCWFGCGWLQLCLRGRCCLGCCSRVQSNCKNAGSSVDNGGLPLNNIGPCRGQFPE
jgi:hypothetical protein